MTNPDMERFGKPLGKSSAGGGIEINFGIGGSLKGFFDEFFALNAGSGLFGIGESLAPFFDDFFNANGGLFGIGAGDPGSAFYVPAPPGQKLADPGEGNGPLIGG